MSFKSIIEDIRNNYQHAPQRTFHVSHPYWVNETPYCSIYREMKHLATQSKIVYAHLVQANSNIFHRTLFNRDLLGDLLYSMDPYYDDHTEELRALAKELFSYKNTNNAPREISYLVDLITDEYAHVQNVELPRSITPHGKVYFTTFMIWRKHLIDKVLKTSIFPIFADPDNIKSCMIVPKEYWSKEYIDYYNHRIQPKRTFTTEEIAIQKKLIEDKAQNRIILSYKSNQKTTILGQSKFGGSPHAPKNFIWPKSNDGYLHFICQINLNELSSFDLDNLLPKKGILYVFYDMDKMVDGNEIEDHNYYKLIYSNDDELFEIDQPDDLPCYDESKIFYILDKDYPLTDEIENVSFEVIEKLYPSRLNEQQEMNQIFGYPFIIQSSMKDDFKKMYFKTYQKNSNSHRLLLQLGNFHPGIYDEIMFGDAGNIYFFIDDEDLKEGNFDKAILFLQCY